MVKKLNFGNIKYKHLFVMVFKFRMLSDEKDNFARDYEVRYDMPLADFRTFVRNSLGYSPAEMVSFFKSDAEWEKLEEFTSIDVGVEDVDIDPHDDIEPPRFMGDLTLKEIIWEKFDRLIYVFDVFSERQFYLQLIEIKPVEKESDYPRMTFTEGEPPVQFTDETLADRKSFLDEAMQIFGNYSK